MTVKQFDTNITIDKLADSIKLVNTEISDKTIERIKLSDVTSSIAFWYERIRNTVDYKDEHLLAKNAAERILKRLIFIEGRRSAIARPLIYELIRGRYLLNDTVPVTKIGEIEAIIGKYVSLFEEITEKFKNNSEKAKEMHEWLLAIAAFEIEKNLISIEKEETLVECMYDTISKDIIISEKVLNERDSITQIYISILRSLFKTDRAMLSYYLLKAYYPEWFGKEWQNVYGEILDNLQLIKRKLDHDIDNPIGERLLRFCKKRAVAFMIIFDLMQKKPDKFLKTVKDSQIIFEKEVETACSGLYEKAKEKLKRTVVRSIMYIFITKIVLAFIIEAPYEINIMHTLNLFTLGINVIFPPLLMFIVGSSIRIPVGPNTAQIVKEANYAVYKNRKKEEPPYVAKLLFSKKTFMVQVFNAAYLLTFLISFGILVYILGALNFNIVSGALFMFFLSIVSFFGIKIRQSVKDIIVVEGKESVLSFIIDLFSLPIVRAGRWISERFSQVNIFVFILDLIIEAPFKLFVQIFEDWIKFLKEKKEEIY